MLLTKFVQNSMFLKYYSKFDQNSTKKRAFPAPLQKIGAI
jgi:hypothetical protein